MRILIVNTVYKRGGAAGIAQTLHRELSRLDGWESLFAYGRGPKGEEAGTVRFALQPEVYLHVVLTRLTAGTGKQVAAGVHIRVSIPRLILTARPGCGLGNGSC